MSNANDLEALPFRIQLGVFEMMLVNTNFVTAINTSMAVAKVQEIRVGSAPPPVTSQGSNLGL